ncbi:MAG TPA: DedA family protein [Geminicoccaceae bacterium]|nr:DedA family protein [Geminicoccaceae bacterium]
MFDWITGLVRETGYAGVLLLMLAENLFPPIPSELVMPLAGFTAARGELHLAGVILAGTVGSLLGALFWYQVGRWLGAGRLKRWAARHGRWLTLAPHEVDQACRWFERHCGKAVLLGRLVPTVRTLISVPAGIAGMRLGPFLACSAIGTGLWTALLAAAGWLLGEQHRRVGEYLDPVANAILGLLVLGYLYRVWSFPRRAAAPRARQPGRKAFPP